MEYDAEVIKTFAKQLYSQARRIVVSYTIFGGILGLLAGGAAAAAGSPAGISVLVGTLLGGAIGYTMGSSSAFRLKLDAQIALAQVQIEANTRQA